MVFGQLEPLLAAEADGAKLNMSMAHAITGSSMVLSIRFIIVYLS